MSHAAVRPGPRSRVVAQLRGYRLGTVVLVVAALAAGQALTTAFPQERESTPFVVAGVVDEPVELRYGVVQVGQVQGSTRTRSNVLVVESPGVLLVVPVEFTALGRAGRLSHVALVDTQGRTFTPGVGDRTPYSARLSQPGIPVRTTAVLEVPLDAVVGARLQLATNLLDQRGDDLAEVDLGLTEQDAAAFAARQEPLDLPAPEVGQR